MVDFIKRNTVREDGKIFWGYDMFKKHIWLTKEQFDHRKQVHNKNQKNRSEKYRNSFVRTNFKRGDVRSDGMIFWVYDKSSPNPEKWITKEKFDYLISYRKLKRDSQKNSQRVNEAKKLKLRQGHKREDGMIFWCYNKQCSDGIYCVNEQKFQQLQLKARQSKTDWAKKFPHVSCAYPKYRRALKRRAIHPDHDRNDDKKFSAICKILRPEIDLHIDHIVPLDKGGIHHRYNLRLLPAYLNNSKNNRMDSELNPDQQQQCYFWRIMTRVLTATYDHEHQLT